MFQSGNSGGGQHHNWATASDPSGKLGGAGYHEHGAGVHAVSGQHKGSPGQLAAKLEGEPGVRNAGALAAAIDRRIKSHQAGGPTRS